jgi:hypothetical protein
MLVTGDPLDGERNAMVISGLRRVLLMRFREESGWKLWPGTRNCPQAHIVFHVRGLAHADDCCGDVGGATHELECRCCVRWGFWKRFSHEPWNMSDEPTGIEWRTGKDRRTRILQAVEDRATMPIRTQLAFEHCTLTHRESVGELERT